MHESCDATTHPQDLNMGDFPFTIFFNFLPFHPHGPKHMYIKHITFLHLSTLQVFDTHKHKVKLGFGFDLLICCVKKFPINTRFFALEAIFFSRLECVITSTLLP
jgi:hypothetical protein